MVPPLDINSEVISINGVPVEMSGTPIVSGTAVPLAPKTVRSSYPSSIKPYAVRKWDHDPRPLLTAVISVPADMNGILAGSGTAVPTTPNNVGFSWKGNSHS